MDAPAVNEEIRHREILDALNKLIAIGEKILAILEPKTPTKLTITLGTPRHK